MTPLLQQSEDQFGYEVIARVLDRSADGNRVLDTLLFTLMATQAAIYAIIPDKVHGYSRAGWDLLLAGFVAAVLGTALTLFVREGPNPRSFATDFPDQPEDTRRQYIEDYVRKAKANEQLRSVKTLVLGSSILMTLISLVIVTAGRAGAI